MGKRSNPNVCASVLWWGEEGKGTIFRLESSKLNWNSKVHVEQIVLYRPANEESQKIDKRFIRAIYGIISGPKRFSDYLNGIFFYIYDKSHKIMYTFYFQI